LFALVWMLVYALADLKAAITSSMVAGADGGGSAAAVVITAGQLLGRDLHDDEA